MAKAFIEVVREHILKLVILVEYQALGSDSIPDT